MPLEALLQSILTELDDENTIGFGLTGSHARGDAQPYSDIDVWRFVRVMPDDPHAGYTLRQYGDNLVSLTTSTIDSQREKMARPENALSTVPGLRQMRILLDKTGELAALAQEAHDFRWEMVQEAANIFASHDLLGNAEEAYKVMSGLRQSDDHLILFWLPWLVVGLTRALAVQRGILVESENNYYRQVQRAVGLDSEWTQLHRLAMGLVVASPDARGRAGLRLYRETATLLDAIILPEHRPVIEQTLRLLARYTE
ncbi:MAG TPA: nucleotidyltransferase domain-containing protein [Spirillospora sp.]|nr:nucleotidyltransferase domain-containing protein [Spirillospora sp.]